MGTWWFFVHACETVYKKACWFGNERSCNHKLYQNWRSCFAEPALFSLTWYSKSFNWFSFTQFLFRFAFYFLWTSHVGWVSVLVHAWLVSIAHPRVRINTCKILTFCNAPVQHTIWFDSMTRSSWIRHRIHMQALTISVLSFRVIGVDHGVFCHKHNPARVFGVRKSFCGTRSGYQIETLVRDAVLNVREASKLYGLLLERQQV